MSPNLISGCMSTRVYGSIITMRVLEPGKEIFPNSIAVRWLRREFPTYPEKVTLGDFLDPSRFVRWNFAIHETLGTRLLFPVRTGPVERSRQRSKVGRTRQALSWFQSVGWNTEPSRV